MTELVVLEQLKPLEIFTPEGTSDILEKIKKEARSHALDISTDKGREQIRSLAYKIARSKTLLDDMGKDLVADQKKQISLIDAERKRIRDELDDLKEEIRAPLTEWEEKEKSRVAAQETALLEFDAALRFDLPNPPSAVVLQRIEAVEKLYARDWQEFGKRAQLAFDVAQKRLADVLVASQKYESEQAELERLRKEQAEREQQEREEKIRQEAAAKAKAEAEETARKEAEAEAARVKAEQDKAEQDRQRLERERAEADVRAKQAEEDRLAAIAKAEADRKAAEEQAERERAEAERKAKEAADAAAQRERDRIEEEKKAEADATAKREADKKHRAKVNHEALSALVASGLSEADAKKVIEAVAKGLIPHVKISY